MAKTVLAISIALLLSGCGVFQFNKDVSVDQKAGLLQSSTRTATYFGLSKGIKDKAEQVAMANVVRGHARDILVSINNPESAGQVNIMAEVEKIVLKLDIKTDEKILILQAKDLLFVYFIKLPTVVLEGDNLKYALSFLEGVVDGCDLVAGI